MTKPVLWHIPVSHYSEKARWALELAHLPYREEPHLQVIHSMHTWLAGHGWDASVYAGADPRIAKLGAIVISFAVTWSDVPLNKSHTPPTCVVAPRSAAR